MKTQEKEKTENGQVKQPTTKEEVINLSEKQQELLTKVMKDRAMLQMQLQEIANREVAITSLILDGYMINEEQVVDAQLSPDNTTLTVTIKQ